MQKPKARDRAAASGERLRFTSNILPKWARRTKSLDALLPVLYLRGISAGARTPPPAAGDRSRPPSILAPPVCRAVRPVLENDALNFELGADAVSLGITALATQLCPLPNQRIDLRVDHLGRSLVF